jgi:hypothetical protein
LAKTATCAAPGKRWARRRAAELVLMLFKFNGRIDEVDFDLK